tara:strand:+ start:197 stop:892 length:696 start_codon:yes stop_codon:yes gene_type:complete
MANVNKQSILNKARLDKFILSFNVPDCLKASVTRDERGTNHKSHERVIPDSLQYSVYGAVVPEISVPSITLPQFAQHLKVSSHRRDPFSDITVNFNIDNEFNNYWYIYRWLDILNDQHTAKYDEHNIGTSNSPGNEYYANENQGMPGGSINKVDMHNRPTRKDHINPDILNDYATTFTLYGLNEYNKNMIQFTYKQAFPISLGEIDYSYQDSNEITSNFTFSFSQINVNLL